MTLLFFSLIASISSLSRGVNRARGRPGWLLAVVDDDAWGRVGLQAVGLLAMIMGLFGLAGVVAMGVLKKTSGRTWTSLHLRKGRNSGHLHHSFDYYSFFCLTYIDLGR